MPLPPRRGTLTWIFTVSPSRSNISSLTLRPSVPVTSTSSLDQPLMVTEPAMLDTSTSPLGDAFSVLSISSAAAGMANASMRIKAVSFFILCLSRYVLLSELLR